MNEQSEIKRIAALSAFWLPYLLVPWATGWSYASNVACTFCWSDLFRFAFSIFGYGTVGCLFYAATAKDRSAQEFRSRLWRAMGINVCLFLLTMQLAADWRIIFL